MIYTKLPWKLIKFSLFKDIANGYWWIDSDGQYDRPPESFDCHHCQRNGTAAYTAKIFDYFQMETDTVIRLGAFLGIFAILSTAEFFAPRRRLTTSKSRRWFANLTIVALNPLSVALVYPVLPLGVALLGRVPINRH
jgi:hypothetical protein